MAELGPRGQAFHDALCAALVKHREAMVPLIVEVARTVDRLQDLDDVIAGKGVLDLLRFRLTDDEGHVAEVKFDAILSEARQQQTTLAGLMKVITPNLNADAATEERDLLDEIAQRRAARRGAGAAKSSPRAKRQS